jgi:hypothetical protein
MRWHTKRLLAVFAFTALSAHASTILYTDGGTFSPGTESSEFSGPSETWAFHFEADSNPVPSDFGAGGFSFPFFDFGYSLDGSPVAITPTFTRFFSLHNGGGFLICFTGTTTATCTNGLESPFDQPQLYTGMTSAPTLSTGTFAVDFGVVVTSGGITNAFDEGAPTLHATAVPEPSTWLTLATGLLALGGRRLRRRR